MGEIVDFFSRYILNGLNGINGGKSGFDGLLFNLNDLFELILRKSLSSLYKGNKEKSYFRDGAINSIVVERSIGKKSYKSMIPDCLGIFENLKDEYRAKFSDNFEGKVYIIDAKHKMYFKDGQLEDISRSDFYQITSYGRTYNNAESLNAIYSLVGIQEEREVLEDKSFSSREYVRINGNVPGSVAKIYFNDECFEILQVSLKFAQVLYDLATSDDTEKEKIYSRIGECLLDAYSEQLKGLSLVK